jgi:2-polyprenyl-3-methyl-5-hydroxy-6-metoxy-1,4-benzoquinol methylase
MSNKNISGSESEKDHWYSKFDSTYFAPYIDNPERQKMYEMERTRVEAFKEGGRILDVGCGLGKFLAQFDPQKWDRYGVDVSDIAIQSARMLGIKVNDVDRSYDYPDEYFDVIVLRGSLQLIPTPFIILKKCIQLLSPGGYLIFLSTPNSNSPYYWRFKTLPILSPHLNFLIPSDLMMTNALKNMGLTISRTHYPYIDGPYASPLRDHLFFLLSFVGFKRKFPFWKSVMEIYAQKPVISEYSI